MKGFRQAIAQEDTGQLYGDEERVIHPGHAKGPRNFQKRWDLLRTRYANGPKKREKVSKMSYFWDLFSLFGPIFPFLVQFFPFFGTFCVGTFCVTRVYLIISRLVWKKTTQVVATLRQRTQYGSQDVGHLENHGTLW